MQCAMASEMANIANKLMPTPIKHERQFTHKKQHTSIGASKSGQIKANEEIYSAIAIAIVYVLLSGPSLLYLQQRKNLM